MRAIHQRSPPRLRSSWSSRSLLVSSRRSWYFSAWRNGVRGASCPRLEPCLLPLTPSSCSQVHLSSSPLDPALASPVVEPGPFGLLDLPNDVISIVLEHAYGFHPPRDDPFSSWTTGLKLAHKPVCKQLWPFQEALVYRHIEIRTYEQLVKIKAALVGDVGEGDEGLGRLVRALVLDTYEFPSGLDRGVDGDQEGPGMPDYAAYLLAQLLGALGNLLSLKIILCNDFFPPRNTPVDAALLDVIVQDRASPVKLPHLQSLRVWTAGESVDAGVAQEAVDVASWFRQFSQFKNLVTLEMHFDTRQPPSFIQDNSQIRPVLAKLSRLELWIDFGQWLEPLRDVTPRLVDLKIASTSSSRRHFLLGLPSDLLRLDISTDGNDLEPIDDLLPSLFRLEYVRLEDACDSTTRLPTSLGALRHLEILDFGFNAEVSDALLLRLVDGPTRLKPLRHLRIDISGALRGPTLLRKHLVLPGPSERDASGVWAGWTTPHWPAGLSEAGLARVVDVARTHGVEVGGWCIGVLFWRAAYERERDVVAVCRGVSTGDWTDARRFRGDEVVEAFLARRGREGRRSSLGHELELFGEPKGGVRERRGSI